MFSTESTPSEGQNNEEENSWKFEPSSFSFSEHPPEKSNGNEQSGSPMQSKFDFPSLHVEDELVSTPFGIGNRDQIFDPETTFRSFRSKSKTKTCLNYKEKNRKLLPQFTEVIEDQMEVSSQIDSNQKVTSETNDETGTYLSCVSSYIFCNYLFRFKICLN